MKSVDSLLDYQLEFLIENKIHFIFLNLSQTTNDLFLNKDIRIKEDELEDYLQKNVKDKKTPIVLVCEDGRLSKDKAEMLCDKGFINVCYLEEGLNNFKKLT